MKAAVLTGIRQMEIREQPAPELRNDHDVLLKLASVGVCGSDIHYYLTGRIGSQVIEYPFTVGHECSATVETVGAAVTKVAPGDRVAVEPAISCGKCDQCLAGRAHTCRRLLFLGCPGQVEGCLSEYLVMPEQCCIPVRREMTMEEAALIEPFAIGCYAVRQSVPLENAAIGILGAGPIGLSVLTAARQAGAKKIYVTDKINARINAARAGGATWSGNPDTDNIISAISEQEPLLLDAVFECCGEQDALDQGIELLKPGGKLILIGIPTVDRITFSPEKIRRSEICIQNIRRQNESVQPAIDLVTEGKCDIAPMITHRFSLEQTKDAFELVADYRDGVIKAMINFN